MSGESQAGPQLATGSRWDVKPPYCVNIGFTADGLRRLGLPASVLDSFPQEFLAGAAARAEIVGDDGPSDPSTWKPGWNTPDCHFVLTLFAQTAGTLEEVSAAVRERLIESADILAEHTGGGLPGQLTHFGYRDGFSQPRIEGGLPTLVPEMFPPTAAGAFVLGYPSQFDQFTYPVPQPAALGHNGSFVAVRILEQDVDAFERFLREASVMYGIDAELLAAKIMGRWRNGVPLALSPSTDRPDPPIPPDQYNSFDYVDDPKGQRCPMGSHIRRHNPRKSSISGGGGLKHRLVRRGLPYGPPYDPTTPDDRRERGLLGLFICASLKDQFEFLMADWVNSGHFAPGIGGTKDPILGNHSTADSKFVVPVEGGPPVKITGFSRFVTTRGGAYCFLPSVTAVRYLAREF